MLHSHWVRGDEILACTSSVPFVNSTRSVSNTVPTVSGETETRQGLARDLGPVLRVTLGQIGKAFLVLHIEYLALSEETDHPISATIKMVYKYEMQTIEYINEHEGARNMNLAQMQRNNDEPTDGVQDANERGV